MCCFYFFFFKQKTAYEMRISDWSSDVCSSDLIVTTHSPNLTSKIPLKNIVLLHRQRAFSLAEGETGLSPNDYRFLQRFLDTTKANLFFARGIIVVEGDEIGRESCRERVCKYV